MRSEQGAGEVEGEEAMEVAGRLWAVPAEAWEAAGVAGAVALKAEQALKAEKPGAYEVVLGSNNPLAWTAGASALASDSL